MYPRAMAGELILVVEDEPRIADVLEGYLRSSGFRTERAADGIRALELWRSASPDAILLDLMIPKLGGLEVAKKIRQESDTPILIITAKVEPIDRLLGLELGADDYITKPFSPPEVIARVKAVLRRSKGLVRAPKVYRVGALEFDIEKRITKCGGESIDLTPIHWRLLEALVKAPERVFSRGDLVEVLEDSLIDERTIDAHVRNLRNRLGNCGSQIETVRGLGFRMVPNEP